MLYLTRNKRKGRRNTGIWYIRGTVRVWRDGRLTRIPVEQSTKTTDKAEAEAILEQRQQAIKRQNVNNQTDAPPFSEWVANYIEATGQRRFLDRILDFYENTPADQITDEKILTDGPKAYPGCSPATIRRQWDTPLRAIIRHNTQPRRRKVEDRQRTYFFTPAQAEALIQAFALEDSGKAGPWAKPLLIFLFGTGARMGETIAINPKYDLFLNHGFVMLRDTKSGQERRVTLIPKVKAALSLLPNLNEDGPLFRRWDGEPFAERENRGGQIRTRFQRAVKEIGMDPRLYTPHVCRHSWATWFYSQTKDVVRLKKEGGWRSQQYERYVQLSSDELGQEARAYNWDFDGTGEKARSGAVG